MANRVWQVLRRAGPLNGVSANRPPAVLARVGAPGDVVDRAGPGWPGVDRHGRPADAELDLRMERVCPGAGVQWTRYRPRSAARAQPPPAGRLAVRASHGG